MAYPPGYWAELVRSSSSGSIVEDATGSRIWLRTSDGEPLEQQHSFDQNSWLDISRDTDEPDLVGTTRTNNYWRARKAGENWIPRDLGLRFSSIPWNGASVYRIFGPPPPPDVAPSFGDPTGDAISGTAGTILPSVTVPEAAGNPAPTYADVGLLPDGCSFDPSTRVLTIQPGEGGAGIITIRATNRAGTADWTVRYVFLPAYPRRPGKFNLMLALPFFIRELVPVLLTTIDISVGLSTVSAQRGPGWSRTSSSGLVRSGGASLNYRAPSGTQRTVRGVIRVGNNIRVEVQGAPLGDMPDEVTISRITSRGGQLVPFGATDRLVADESSYSNGVMNYTGSGAVANIMSGNSGYSIRASLYALQ